MNQRLPPRILPALACFAALASGAPSARADDTLHPGAPLLDPPTLVALGVALPITGDDNFNATVTMRYRRAGTTAWRRSPASTYTVRIASTTTTWSRRAATRAPRRSACMIPAASARRPLPHAA